MYKMINPFTNRHLSIHYLTKEYNGITKCYINIYQIIHSCYRKFSNKHNFPCERHPLTFPLSWSFFNFVTTSQLIMVRFSFRKMPLEGCPLQLGCIPLGLVIAPGAFIRKFTVCYEQQCNFEMSSFYSIQTGTQSELAQ